jgi:alpha-beta hydrolase superfamily lysophospholipase
VKRFAKKLLKRTLLLLAFFIVAALAYFSFSAWRGKPLQAWHTFVPKEMKAKALKSATWQDYIAHENKLSKEVYENVTRKIPDSEKVLMNRYYENSLVYPPRLAHNWNRSYVLHPEGEPVGAVVLLHGLTDTPYSMRHVARLYAQKGFVAFGLRLPGHGTTPAGLTDVRRQDWSAATQLAMREAARVAGPNKALHIAGFSTGGALAVKYVLDALEDPTLPRADRVVLFSPMIGITRFAKLAGLASVPSYFQAFANAAWLSVIPEFNPFKYNSFPVNAARQSHLLSDYLQEQQDSR